ncbi:SusC/RagA family TonB-linked outer membrane protein [Bacteroides sp. 519]|uniref:SusC/RagA family TonB-linked outer membrane protein n=1 Tax=Bacteroides sp. 519 TaxID=2302937 RepID=UPI001EF24402|nr:SusC/RagA family TonB-linked outer membrane protein [Bacteroides sp. 519]
MKVTTLVLFLFVFSLHAESVHSQNIKLSIKKTAALDEFIEEIEKQSNYLFVYTKDVDINQQYSVNEKESSIQGILKSLFATSNINYEIEGSYIVLSTGRSNSPQQNQKRITGTITDERGEPIIGANVVEKGAQNGVITDLDGNFSIYVTENATLQISFIGYLAQEIAIKNQSTLKIVMREDQLTLDEVVVIGYGTMRKKDLTGAISQVKADNLIKENPTSIQDLLRSGVPGLNVGVDNTAKGGGDIMVRGQRSLSAGNSPLIVLDNVVFFGELSEINPQDIEQIDVLKDASSAAIFGAKSANGVVIITTKKGKTERPVVRFDASLGIITLGKHRDVYDAEGYLKFRGDWFTSSGGFDKNPGKYYAPTPENLTKYGITAEQWRAYTDDSASDEEKWISRLGLFPQEKENYLAGKTYNWFDEAYRTGIKQDYNISLSGRSDKINYYLSLGYLDSKGVIVGDDYSTIRSNLKLDAIVNNFLTIGANINFQNRTDGNLKVNTGDVLTRNSPYALPYDEEGNLTYRPMGANSLNEGYNYRYENQYRDLDKGYTIFNTILSAKVKLPFNINYTLNFAPRFQWFHNRYWLSSQHPAWSTQYNGYVDRSGQKNFDWVVSNTINWEYTFAKKHNVNITLSQEAEEHQTWYTLISARDFTPTDALGYHYINTANKMKSSFSSEDTHSTGDALLGRLFYSFDSKYMATLSVRRDGYSAFGTSNPRATFGSVALAWNFANESFFKWDAMNYGKLRASWGSNGNRSIGIYKALSNLTSGTGGYAYLDAGGALKEISQLYVDRMANPKLRWERTTSWNFGLDFGFLNHRINGSVEYYHMPTTDLIMNQSLPTITGFSNITTNLGKVLNKGFELTVNTVNIKNRDFEWGSTFNFSMNRNKIVHLYYTYENVLDADGNIVGVKEVDDVANKWFVGKDINEIWNYKLLGIWQEDEKEEAALYKQVPGDPKVLDKYNIDKREYSNEDKEFLGSRSPKFRWSLRNDFTFLKNFTASVNIYSLWGHKEATTSYINTGYEAERFNQYKINYWTPDKPTNKYARLGATNRASGAPLILDRSFIRLESISLEYNVPKKYLSKYRIEGLRLTGSIRNVAVWTKEPWYTDPEYLGNSNTAYPSYVPRTFSFGASLTF